MVLNSFNINQFEILSSKGKIILIISACFTPIECEEGYRGRKCKDINECQRKNPCQNDGLCLNHPGNYLCNCQGTGYDGDHCEIDIDECETGTHDCLTPDIETCYNTITITIIFQVSNCMIIPFQSVPGGSDSATFNKTIKKSFFMAYFC